MVKFFDGAAVGSIYNAGTNVCTPDNVNNRPASTGGVATKSKQMVFVAIYVVTNAVFASSNTTGLIGEVEDLHMGSNSTSTNIDANAGTVTDSVTFAAGTWLYGRWSKFQLASGSVIAYVAH